MSPRRSRMETAFLWTWALLFGAGVLLGVAVFSIETFTIPLSRAVKKELALFLAFAILASLLLLPLWAATTGSRFFDGERVRWNKSLSCLGCWLGLVVPAVAIALAGVFAPDVLPHWIITGFGWAWRLLFALSLLPFLLSVLLETWQAWRARFTQFKRWLQSQRNSRS